MSGTTRRETMARRKRNKKAQAQPPEQPPEQGMLQDEVEDLMDAVEQRLHRELLVNPLVVLGPLLQLHRKDVQWKHADVEGQDQEKVQRAWETLRTVFKDFAGDVQATMFWKALSAAGKLDEHGMSFVYNNVRITLYACLAVTHLSKADRQTAATLLGQAVINELTDKVLGNSLPSHLGPPKKEEAKKEEAKKEEPKQQGGKAEVTTRTRGKKVPANKENHQEEAAQVKGGTKKGAKEEEGGQEEAAKVEGDKKTAGKKTAAEEDMTPKVPCYVHVLDTYTANLPDLPAFVKAAAEYYLLRADLYGGEESEPWKAVKPVLENFIETYSPFVGRQPQSAVPHELVGIWPEVPCRNTTKAMHKGWDDAERDKAEVLAALRAAAAAAGSSGAAAAAAAGDPLVLLGLVAGQAAAAAGKAGYQGSGQGEEQHAAAEGAAGGGSAAMSVSHPPGDSITAPDLDWSRVLAVAPRQKELQDLVECITAALALVPEELHPMVRTSLIEMLYGAQRMSPPQNSTPLAATITAAACPAAALLQQTLSAQSILLDEVEGLLAEHCPSALAAAVLAAAEDGREHDVADAVKAVQQELEHAAGGSDEAAMLTLLAGLLEGYGDVNQQLQDEVQRISHELQLPTMPRSSSSSSSAGAGSSSIPETSSYGWDYGTPNLHETIRKMAWGAGVGAKVMKRRAIDTDTLEHCPGLLAGGEDNLCGRLDGFKDKDNPAGGEFLKKVFLLGGLTMTGEWIAGEDLDVKHAITVITGRMGIAMPEVMNEAVVTGLGASQDSHVFPVEGLTLFTERLEGQPWEGLTGEQQAAWRKQHHKIKAPAPLLPEGGLVLVYLGLLVPYRGKDISALREGLVTSEEFLALELEQKQELLGAVSRILIHGYASVLDSLHNLQILHLDGKPNNLVIQPCTSRTGIPLLDILLDIRYGKATAVDAGTSYTLAQVVGKDGRIVTVATRMPDGCTLMYAAYFIYPQVKGKKSAAQGKQLLAWPVYEPEEEEEEEGADSAAGASSAAELPPDTYDPDFTKQADTHMLCMLWAEMGTCLVDGEGEDELVLSLRMWQQMPWFTWTAKTVPWQNYTFMEQVAMQAVQALRMSTPKSMRTEVYDAIRKGLRKEGGCSPADVYKFCGRYYDADCKLVEKYIQLWFGGATGQRA